ncbi:MAG: FAD-dependent oxidoreductase [Microlunatus sp.]|nr:FAD-dependent oxidoreductase [Microlunatus sp.]
MTCLDADVMVIGAGLAGSAAAWALTRRGAEVVVLEGRRVGHLEGSSHGSSRIFRRAYLKPEYVELTGQAQHLWSELAGEHGAPLLRRVGGIDHGPDRQIEQIKAAFDQFGVPSEMLSAAQAEQRWPGMTFAGEVLFHDEAGVINADETVRALLNCATTRGAQLREDAEVDYLEQFPDTVVAHTRDGQAHRARRVVVAAGAWESEILPVDIRDRLPATTVTQQQVFHFPLRHPEVAWPAFIHNAGNEVYGLPSGTDGGKTPAFKVAEHGRGTPTTARTRDFRVDDASRRRITDYVTRWLPGLFPEIVAETTCLYTITDDRDFVLDRVGGIVVASPCSGHGAKFTPLIGELLADLALTDKPGSARFALHPRRLAR